MKFPKLYLVEKFATKKVLLLINEKFTNYRSGIAATFAYFFPFLLCCKLFGVKLGMATKFGS